MEAVGTVKNAGINPMNKKEFTFLFSCEDCDTILKATCESYEHLEAIEKFYRSEMHNGHKVRVEKYIGGLQMADVKGDQDE